MRKVTAIGFLFAVCALSGAAMATTEIYQFRDHAASGGASIADSTGCIFIDFGVWVSESVSHAQGAPTTSTDALVTFLKYDICNSIWIAAKSGYTSAASLSANGSLDSATLSATVDLYDEVTGTTTATNVSMTWTGQGEIERGAHVFKYTLPDGMAIARTNGFSRGATFSGTIGESIL